MKSKLSRNVTEGGMDGSTECSMSCTSPLVMDAAFLFCLFSTMLNALSAKLYKDQTLGAQ
jgi:hypothetical protein